MRPLAAALLLLLGSCSDPLPVSAFGPPAFDPVRFFTGPVHSWGVLEDRGGAPTAIVTTEGVGVADGPDAVHFPQTLHVGTDAPVLRDWRFRRVAPGRFEATAPDVVGTAEGEASGRAFHWRWTLALRPGNPLADVSMEQWWYLLDDGAMLNRTTIRKLGIVVAEVTERFVRAGS